MQNSPYAPGPSGAPDPSFTLDPADPADPQEESGTPGTARMPGVLVFALVVVALHALATLLGGWVILDDNYTGQEHNQELLMPMHVAWFFAVFCWGLGAAQILCVVRARKRSPWIRVALIVFLGFTALSSIFGFVASVLADAYSPALLVMFGIDVAALWQVCGEDGGRWFSRREPS